MKKPQLTTPEPNASSTWERLEEFARAHVQHFVQALLEEVTELLGRTKSARREAVDAAPGYRNGYGKPRRLTLTSGTITVRRPRVRDLNERFVSRVLPLFKRQTKEVGELLPQLYVHGLALGDFELALRELLGEGAPLSPASLLRLKTQWQLEYETWKQRRLDDLEVVYIGADGLYVKAGLEDTRAALLVMIGVLTNGQKVVLAAPKAMERLADDWERLVTFYQFPREHWPHLRTSNVVESPFATVRLRTTAAKRFKKVENATALIWKILQVAESTLRRLKGAELLPTVYAGARYVDGAPRSTNRQQQIGA